jgi:hypothetical protein
MIPARSDDGELMVMVTFEGTLGSLPTEARKYSEAILIQDEMERLAQERRISELQDLLAWVVVRQGVQRSQEA